MRRQDYELIARAMRGNVPDAGISINAYGQWFSDCAALADALAAQNARFNRAKFMTACGA